MTTIAKFAMVSIISSPGGVLISSSSSIAWLPVCVVTGTPEATTKLLHLRDAQGAAKAAKAGPAEAHFKTGCEAVRATHWWRNLLPQHCTGPPASVLVGS